MDTFLVPAWYTDNGGAALGCLLVRAANALSRRPTTYHHHTMPNPITEAREIAATLSLSVLQTAPGKYRLLEETDGGHLVPVSGAPTSARELRAFLEGVEYGRRTALAD